MKNKHILFFVKHMWKAGPIATIANFTQYVMNGLSASLILLFTGELVNTITYSETLPYEQSKQKIIILVSLIAIMLFVQLFFYKFSQVLRERQIFSVQQHLDKEICKRLINTPSDTLDTKKFQDDFRIVNETNTKIYLFITYLSIILGQAIQLITPLILLVKLSYWIIIPCVAFAILCTVLIMKTQVEYWSGYISNTGIRRKMDYFLGLFTNKQTLSVIKAFKTENEMFKKAKSTVTQSIEEANKLILKRNKKYVKIQLLILILPIFIAIAAVYAFSIDKIMVGDVIMFIGLGKTIHSSIISLGVSIQQLQDINSSLQTLYDFLFKDRLAEDNIEHSFTIPENISTIDVENLTFYYPGATKPALENVSFSLKSGGITAIVGENGSGKTTFIKILFGLYRNYIGTVKINGFDIRNISSHDLSKLMAPCFQDFLKPKFLLREAVGISNTTEIPNDDKIKNTLSSVEVDDILNKISLDTQLGTEFENGTDLSIGQWQKIATARAFFGDKSLVAFDEPISAIDVFGEKQFLNCISEKSKETDFCLLISHRMLGMKLCKDIYVFDKGRLIEKGSHAELMEIKGKYYSLYKAQDVFEESI
ncbi:MAG: ABC transporter ATP-binding protein [Clostridia bacterium]|nr:ABC transporter ATP-binding protein [Clostridia bacterium]